MNGKRGSDGVAVLDSSSMDCLRGIDILVEFSLVAGDSTCKNE